MYNTIDEKSSDHQLYGAKLLSFLSWAHSPLLKIEKKTIFNDYFYYYFVSCYFYFAL